VRLLIIGSTGFIGTYLVRAAVARQMEVVTLSRKGDCPLGAVEGYKWTLGQPIPLIAYVGVDCSILLAHDFEGEQGAQRTLDATVAITKQLHAAGVERQLFFSSYSSGKHASSVYGRTKYAIEDVIGKIPSVVIVRPGLVLGEGGLYGRIRKWARILPVIPLPDGGIGSVPVIAVETLCDLCLQLAIATSPPSEANLFEEHLRSLRQLVLDAASECNRRPWILPIPSHWLSYLLLGAAKLRIRLPINADNLAGFVSNQSATHTSTLHKF